MKLNLKKYLCSIIGLVFFTSTVRAQVIQPDTNQHHIIQTGGGFDHSLIALHLGYSRYLSKFRSAVFTEFTQSSALLGTGNHRTRLGVIHWLPLHQHWALQGKIALVYTQSDNVAGKYKALGYQLDLTLLYLTKKGSLGFDVSYNPFFATHIIHSDYWKEYLYEDAKDGWYSTTVRTFRIGGVVSRYLNKVQSLEASLKAGYQTNGKYDKLVPGIYFNFHLNYRLP
ncbi:hypothetical protein [Chondrinema litorale]|uniref:hypothetical protein n=1 Tax=Chondrinema litorale TaxID=2994555 RepID=UPI002542B1ED|nr:hypothetical protein [Chondrinema litorale]UZR96769.1 hypothetical protein OQ292_24015 [Chondrinema litorale]